MSKTPRIITLTALAALTLTGCMTPGWEGTGVVTEVELLEPEAQGNTLDHEGVDITVRTDRGTEASVTVEDCPPGAIVIEEHVTVADVEDQCGHPINYSQDD